MHNNISELEQLPDSRAYIDRESALELARRSLLGAPVYTLISLIMLAGTPLAVNYGPWAFGVFTLLMMLGAARVWFALDFELRYDLVGEKAVSHFVILTTLQMLTLGILSAMVIWQYWAAKEVVLTIVLSAGCIVAGTSAMSVRRSSQLIFLACVLAPLAIAVYVAGGLIPVTFIVGFLSLMAFLVLDGGEAKSMHLSRLREHYEEKVSRQRAVMEQEARQEFVNGIDLDIRAQINSIIGMTALLVDEKLGWRAGEIAETISKSGNTLWRLIGDLPGTIKNTPATQEVQLEDENLRQCNLRQCIEGAIGLYKLEAASKGLEFTTELGDMPENVTSCNQMQLEQVLANLMTNAVQYTDKGSITLSSACQNLHDGTVLVEFSIADTGPGIPLECHESVFSLVNDKGAKTSGKFGGDGLGLPLCKGLVELMGGDIWIEDNEDQGTIVMFTIRPELDPSDHNWEATGDDVPSQTGIADLYQFPVDRSNMSQFYPHRILIVDDDDIHRQIICIQLQKLGYEADEAADGEQAIEAVMQGTYDLVFMDIRMPSMSGTEATRWIRERFTGGDVRIIALTGDATIEAREQCMRAGMDNFVTKPVHVKDLEAILRHNKRDQQVESVGFSRTGSAHRHTIRAVT